MNHLSEEQIVLHYYGDAEEAAEVQSHLAACPECRAEFARVQAILKQMPPEPSIPGIGGEGGCCSVQ